MDKEYAVTITEVLQRKVKVTAESKEDAEFIAEEQYYIGEHILNENDLVSTTFKAKAT